MTETETRQRLDRWAIFDREWFKSQSGDWVQWDDVKPLLAELAGQAAQIQHLQESAALAETTAGDAKWQNERLVTEVARLTARLQQLTEDNEKLRGVRPRNKILLLADPPAREGTPR